MGIFGKKTGLKHPNAYMLYRDAEVLRGLVGKIWREGARRSLDIASPIDDHPFIKYPSSDVVVIGGGLYQVNSGLVQGVLRMGGVYVGEFSRRDVYFGGASTKGEETLGTETLRQLKSRRGR